MSDNQHQRLLEHLVVELRNGNMNALQSYYMSYKQDYFNFARKYTRDADMITDSYHDAFIVLYENIMSEKLQQLSSSLKTYVFSVAKYNLLNKLRKSGRTDLVEDEDLVSMHLLESDDQRDEDRVMLLRNALAAMGESCRQMLILFYYRCYSIDAIAHAMGYKNENTVKAHKSRCLKKLRGIVQTRENNHN